MLSAIGRLPCVSTSSGSTNATEFQERLWVPWFYWAFGLVVVVIFTVQLGHNRDPIWTWIGALFFTAVGLWVLLWMSRSRIRVEIDESGERWLHADDAMLPASVVSRSLVVPETAKRNALGRQLDPAAFLVTRPWVPTMVLLVLDDPEDPTPYWFVSSRKPEKLLDSFLGTDRPSDSP